MNINTLHTILGGGDITSIIPVSALGYLFEGTFKCRWGTITCDGTNYTLVYPLPSYKKNLGKALGREALKTLDLC